MTYPIAGPGSALLERLDRVPRDGRWRTTREMRDLMITAREIAARPEGA